MEQHIGFLVLQLSECSQITCVLALLFYLLCPQRYKEECERLQQEYQVTLQQYQASKSEASDTQSTLQLLLTKSSSLKSHSVGSTDAKAAVSPTSQMVSTTPTTLMSSAVPSKTELTGKGNSRTVFGGARTIHVRSFTVDDSG